ncbi:hypothetical protein ABIA35_008500 [Catenulispora sp. MAP12-49]
MVTDRRLSHKHPEPVSPAREIPARRPVPRRATGPVARQVAERARHQGRDQVREHGAKGFCLR